MNIDEIFTIYRSKIKSETKWWKINEGKKKLN